jgi:DNA-directed RNA polymerase specialized sigma24 family protein
MDHPGGYLWRVAQTSVRRQSRHNRFEVPGRAPGAERAASSAGQEWDDELLSSLRRLSEQQRVAILLVHAYGYTLAEAADALGCGVSSLRNHLQRGLRHVRADLEREPR